MDRTRFKTIADIRRWQRARLAFAFDRRLGRAVTDDAGVHAAPGKFAAQPTEFNLWAAIHDHFDAGRFRACRGFVVADAKLHPNHLGTDGDGVFDDGGNRIRRAEYVHHIDRFRDVAQRGIDEL